MGGDRDTAAMFVVATNPDADSSLPYLIRVPLAGGDLILKTGDSWPRTAKVYCHRTETWPAGAAIVEDVPVRSCHEEWTYRFLAASLTYLRAEREHPGPRDAP